MNVHIKTLLASVVAAASLVPAVALAQDTRVIIRDEPDALIQVGAGVSDFTDGLDKATDPGTGWDVRAVFAPKSPLGMEAAYFGALNPVDGGETSAGVAEGDSSLLSTGGEALLRANLGGDRGDIQPYVAAGLGVVEHRIVDEDDMFDDFESDRLDNSTDVLIPAAVGVDFYLADTVTLGARVGYKYYFDDGVIRDEDSADAQSWAATARIGAAF